jgi:hypothetical protein
MWSSSEGPGALMATAPTGAAAQEESFLVELEHGIGKTVARAIPKAIPILGA